jgi:hypothetical protein
LTCVGSVLSDLDRSKSAAVKSFGRYRDDALYLMPLAARVKPSALLFAFGKQPPMRLDFGTASAQVLALAARAPASLVPSTDALRRFVKKEFPGFFND